MRHKILSPYRLLNHTLVSVSDSDQIPRITGKSADTVYWKQTKRWQWWNDVLSLFFIYYFCSDSQQFMDMGYDTMSLCIWVILMHYLWLVKLFSPRKKSAERENDKKYKALSLSNHLLLLWVRLMLLLDWLSARPFTGTDWGVARRCYIKNVFLRLCLYL